jgi:hypothetical protein
MDVDYQAGTKGLKYAADKGLAVVIMEPLRGGRLTNSVPPSIQTIWDGAPVQRTPAEWALRWLWDQPEVSLVLSGMSAIEHVVENVAIAGRSTPGMMRPEEQDLIARVRQAYEDLCPIPCTDCKYCLPCPNNVNIPRVFEIYNELMAYGDENRAQMVYGWLAEDERADLCTECGECLDKCPQMIEIPDWLAKAHEVLCTEEATTTG